MTHSIKEIRNELLSLGSRDNHMGERISDTKDGYLEIMHRGRREIPEHKK